MTDPKDEATHTEDPEEDLEESTVEEETAPDHEPEGTPVGDGDTEEGEDAPAPIEA